MTLFTSQYLYLCGTRNFKGEILIWRTLRGQGSYECPLRKKRLLLIRKCLTKDKRVMCRHIEETLGLNAPPTQSVQKLADTAYIMVPGDTKNV